jgi:hypothetical protein
MRRRSWREIEMRKILSTYPASMTLLLAALCTISGCGVSLSDLRTVDSTCPTPKVVLSYWYTNPGDPNAQPPTPPAPHYPEIAAGAIAELPYDHCIDKEDTGEKWCGCTSYDCFTSKVKNERLSSVVLLENNNIENSKTWVITLDPAYKVVTGDYSNCKSFGSYSNATFQETIQGGKKIIKFTMPPQDLIYPGHQICMLEIKKGTDTYHEHFATDKNLCYGWSEIKWTPP